MGKLTTISGAALLAATLSGAAFAQTGGNMNAPEPNASGTRIVQPATTSTGAATSPHATGRTTGTTGMSSGSNAELGGNNGNNSGSGSNSLNNPNAAAGHN
jgi:hypothetical protein